MSRLYGFHAHPKACQHPPVPPTLGMTRPMRNRTLLSLLAMASLGAQADAQTFTELIREGDPLPGGAGELVDGIDNVDINGSGDWLIELSTDAATNDAVVLHNGTILWQEGTAGGFTPPAGMEAGSFIDVLDINDSGDIMFITPVRTIGTTSNSFDLLVWNGFTVIQEGVTPCNAPGLPAGAFYDGVNEVWQNNNRQLLVSGRVDVGGTTNAIMLRVDIDASGNITSETKLAMEGETLPGPSHVTPVQGFSSSKGRQAINDSGACIWYVDDEHAVAPGSTLSDSNLYITNPALVNTLLYNEADPFPVDLSDVFDHFSTAEVDLNNNGDFVFAGFDRGPSSDDSWIFKSVGGVLTVLAHEGDPTPASVPGSWNVAGFGFGGVVPMSNNADVLWFLDWDDPDLDIDTGLMFNDVLILQEGVSMLAGLVVDDVPNGDTEIAMNDDGSLGILEVVLEDPAGDVDAVFIVTLSGSIGTNYCPAAVNSTGAAGMMSAEGSLTAANNDLTVTASNLPPNQFGLFVTSMQQGFSMGTNGTSNGNLCLGGTIGRLPTILNSGSSGSFSLPVDLTAIPQGNGTVSAMGGQSWNFQAWFRDAVGLGSNFTDGLEVTFN